MTENYTVKYRLEKKKLFTIKISCDSKIKDLLDAVNKKHHLELITVYLKSFNAYLDLDDLLSEWPPDEDDAVFYLTDKPEINPDLFEDDDDVTEEGDDDVEEGDDGEKSKSKTAKVSKARESSESEDDDDDDEDAKSKSKTPAKPKATTKVKSSESSEGEEDSEDAETKSKIPPKPKPSAKLPVKSKASTKPKSSESEDEDDDDSKPKSKIPPRSKAAAKAPAKPKASTKLKSSESEDDDDEDSKPKSKMPAKPKAATKAPVKSKASTKPKSSESSDEDDEDSKPKSKIPAKPKATTKSKVATKTSEDEDDTKSKAPVKPSAKTKTDGPPAYPSIPALKTTAKTKAEDTKSSDEEDEKKPDGPPAYPSIPTIGKEKPLDNFLKTKLKNSFRMNLNSKHVNKGIKDDEFYIYSTQSYEAMTNPSKVKIPLKSTYDDVEKEIKKALNIKSKEKQIHIFLPTGLPFTKKYGKNKNKLENFTNEVETKHNLYVVITNKIDQEILDKTVDNVCSVKDDTMKLLMCPISKCSKIGYSRMACLIGSFYYRGLRTYDFIKSVARCTGFAPLISFLSSMLYNDPITGLMLATVTASLHTIFSKLLPKGTKPNQIFDRCLECACYIVHIEETYIQEKMKGKKAKPTSVQVDKVDLSEDSEFEIATYMKNCGIKNHYQYSPDIQVDDDFDLAVIEKIPNFREIENIFNNYASFNPVPPLSTRTISLTCIMQYIDGLTLLFIGAFDKEDAEETINIIDPFIGKIQTADVEKLAEEVQKHSDDGVESLIDADEVEELIAILFDTSGSMFSKYDSNKLAVKKKKDPKTSKYVPGDTDRFSVAYQYLITFLNRSFGFRLPQLISLISFSQEIKVACDFSPLSPNIETAASKMAISGKSRVWDAIDLAITNLVNFNKDKKYPNAKPRIIVFSDGIDSGSEKKQEKVCTRAIKNKITVDSVILSMVDSCANLCKFSHLTGGYALRSEDIKNVNALFEKEAFLSLKLRPKNDITIKEVTKEIFEEADDNFDDDVDNYDFITQTRRVRLSTPKYVMSEAKKSKKEIGRYKQRLMKELKTIQLAKDDTIKVYVNSNDINNWKVYMKGPRSTEYENHWWFLSITFAEDYPLHPPLFRFITIPYHINISEDGRVCASFLFKSYKASYSIYELINMVKNLLAKPETEFPIQIQKMLLYKDNMEEYNGNIEESTTNAYESFKNYIKGCDINDDSKFEVDENDFENKEDDILEFTADIKLPPVKKKDDFLGTSKTIADDDDGDDDDDHDSDEAD